MKVYVEFEDGSKVELKQIQGLQSECKFVFVRVLARLRPSDAEKIELHLTKKIGKKVIILDQMFGEIFAI